MRAEQAKAVVWTALAALLLGGAAGRAVGPLEAARWAYLPEAVAAALKAAYPGAALWTAEPSGQDEWDLYAVELSLAGRVMEVKVRADGGIVEIQTDVAPRDLPRPVAEGLAKATGRPPAYVWKRETRQEYRGRRWTALDPPRVVYEATLGERRRGRAVAVGPDGAPLDRSGGTASQAAGREVQEASLPPAAGEALRAAFPKAQQVKVLFDQTGLDGRGSYKVELDLAGQEIDVEITADGLLVETQMDISLRELPAPAADRLARVAPGAKIQKIKKKELGARPEGGQVVRLSPPLFAYEIRFLKDGRREMLDLAADGSVVEYSEGPEKERKAIPPAVVATLKAAYPRGELGGGHAARGTGGLMVYSFTVDEPGGAGSGNEVKLTADGVILEVAKPVAMRDLPRAVAGRVAEATRGGTLEALWRRELRARLEAGSVIPHKTPRLVYEARVLKAGKQSLVELAPDGTALR